MNDVLGFFKDKGIRYVQKGSDLLVSCFNKRDHKRGDLNPSLGVDSETGIFYCWSCHVRGNFPQLIAAYGYRNEVHRYAPDTPKKRIIYDIDSLKRGSGISIPGIGRFIEKVHNHAEERDRLYLQSRKINLGGVEKELSDRITSGEGSIADRLEYIRRVDNIGVVDMQIPEGLYRAKHVEYFSERGLPVNFCDHHEIYLAKQELKLPQYNSFLSPRYFYIPIRGVLGNIRSFMGVSFNKKETPRMYYIGPPMSFPMIDLGNINFNKDFYVVEGWLDHYKLQVLGYNSMPTLSNSFSTLHFSLLTNVPEEKNVYFVFDQDVAGYKMMLNVLNYVSRTTTNWYAVLLPHLRYKDIGDIDLLDIPFELDKSIKYPLYQIKKFIIMLGAEKYNGSKEVLNSDRYSFRSDTLYQEFGIEYTGSGNKRTSKTGSRLWEELPVEKKRKDEPSNPWGLVSL
jgi:hypothetical protein